MAKSSALDHSAATRPPVRFLRPHQVEALYGLTQKFLAHARGRGDGPSLCETLTEACALRRRGSRIVAGSATQALDQRSRAGDVEPVQG